MTHPSPRSAKARATHREEHSANSYFRQAILDTNNIQGRFAKEEASDVVGAGARHAKSAGPWSDPTAQALNAVPDQFGVDHTAAPIVGERFEQEPFRFTGQSRSELGFRRELAQSAAPDLASLRDEELEHRRAWASLAQKHAGLDTAKIDQLQGIIDAVDREQRRRLR